MGKKLKLAYVRARVRTPGWWGRRGESFPGHIFHFSSLASGAPRASAYRLTADGRSEADGLVRKNVLAGYLHRHFASCPGFPARFASAARAYRKGGSYA
jgi:cobyrinic acid a,c-diamide synthase